MLLRPQSTSIALTEDDLYYHLGRVISRSVELSAWFHNDNDSIDSHDGEEGEEGYDDGDDGIFTNSDSSLPDFPSESDCADSPCETSDDDRAPETQTHRTVIGMDPSSPALTRSSSSMASNLQSQHERLSRSTDDLPRIPLASSSENDPQAAVESHMVSMQKSPERASRRQSIEVSTGRQLNHSLALALRPVLAPSDQKWPRGLNHLNNPFSPLVFSPASSEPKIIALGAALKDLFSSNVVLLSWCPQHREEIEEFGNSPQSQLLTLLVHHG
ncbi:hypothetical protein P175DRAFT_099636 [Aspergillus ochraceoroseus IBT 24754]|uniref:Uncharacterized protein n=1 Tax=Aspergillus ochraceoroseus IBT 24754 TaxID=1392256 RepID=A0A2T5LMW8_9EURO|nr:uncharacterized protein P175DRAFT_099636 [Aspergillus ochraceoroseus IBT 24754]PTU17628.1 hypothetical protein P175DRAFT_099636 [Aspergillus ochraceoroseus IBT 24754]